MRYDLKEHLEPRMSGAVPWGHIEPMDVLRAINHISLGGSWMTYGGWFLRPDRKLNKDWARYFPLTNQGGGYTGEALVFVYGGGGYWKKEVPGEWVGTKPEVFRVAICKHEKEGSGTQDQERRGYHPGRCKHCGLDMSVDSGD